MSLLLVVGSKESLLAISAIFSEFEVSVWAITGAGFGAGIADVFSVTSAVICGFWAGVADICSVTAAGAGFAGVSARFKEFFAGFSAVIAVIAGGLRLAVSWGRFGCGFVVETVLSTCTESTCCFNSDVSGILTC